MPPKPAAVVPPLPSRFVPAGTGAVALNRGILIDITTDTASFERDFLTNANATRGTTYSPDNDLPPFFAYSQLP